jgi:hypothetical protein
MIYLNRMHLSTIMYSRLERLRQVILELGLRVELPQLEKSHWIKMSVIPLATLYLYTGERSPHEIISFVISVFAILFNMLAHKCIELSQRERNPVRATQAALSAAVCFAVSASVFLTLNLYASICSGHYQIAQLVPQTMNALLALTKVVHYFSTILIDAATTCRKSAALQWLLSHPVVRWLRAREKHLYLRLSRIYIHFLRTSCTYFYYARQQENRSSRSPRPFSGKIKCLGRRLIESRLRAMYHKYGSRTKIEHYFLPRDITRTLGIVVAALVLSALDHNSGILNFFFSVCLCTFAGSQTIDRRDKPARADTYQLLHLYASRLLTICSGLLFFLDRRGVNAMKNAAFAVLNGLVQKIISETRQRASM